jgi:anti-sigma regulatory factor (Ser/Thr protein kinase)
VTSIVRTLRRRPEAAREARCEVRDLCRSHGADLVGDAELVVSELVTNAVRHGAGAITLVLDLLPDGVRVAVADGGPGAPTVCDAEPERIDGRGIALVDRVGTAWGVLPAPDGGKEVWCLVTAGQVVLPDRARVTERV